MEAKEYLGLDVGHKRIGVARASALAMLAEPLKTIATADGLAKLEEIIKDRSAGAIVVGLPRNLNGDDTAQTEWVRDWVQKAQQKVQLPFYWQDEALTSAVAEAEVRANKQPRDIDALAAAILLQDFLDSPETDRVPC